jgi:ketosteroid isomerase-like protein
METASEEPARLFAEAITRGDVDAAVAVCHTRVEFHSMLDISGRLYRGHDGIRRYMDDVASAWDEWRVEVDRITEGPDGRVLIVMTMHARGKGSGVSLAECTAHIWTVDEGKLLRNEPFREPELALRELGLRAEAG